LNILFGNVIRRYISSSPIRKYMSRPNSAAAKDVDIDIADILGQKYRYRIDIGEGDIVSISATAISTHLYCVISLL